MLIWIVVAAAAPWLGVGVLALLRARSTEELPPTPSASSRSQDPLPTCAVVIAARNEELRIEGTVRRLLAQQGVDLQRVVIVDDRSTDRTGDILDALANEDPRLLIHHVQDLPDGWLGKTHACAKGAALLDEDIEWALFADADSWLAPEALVRAHALASSSGADHVCALPELADTTVGGRAIVLVMCVGLFGQWAWPNADHPRSYFGVGSFNFIRHDAYRKVGGHAAIPMEVLEDLRMGRALRQAGFRTRIAFAPSCVSVQWITTLRSFFTLSEKNYFAAVDYSLPRALLFFALVLGSWAVALLGPWLAGPLGWIGPLSFVPVIAAAAVIAHRYSWSPLHAFLAPVVLPVSPAGLLWSAYRTLRYGVRWRGTTYQPPPRTG